MCGDNSGNETQNGPTSPPTCYPPLGRGGNGLTTRGCATVLGNNADIKFLSMFSLEGVYRTVQMGDWLKRRLTSCRFQAWPECSQWRYEGI